MKKYIFVIALCLSNNIWSMQPEKYSVKHIKYYSQGRPIILKRIEPVFLDNLIYKHGDGWVIVTEIIRNSGFRTPIKNNKSFMEALIELNDRKNPPYLIRFLFYCKEKNKRQVKAKL